MKLVTFGCSLTYGSALPDNWKDNASPSKHAWPNELANLLQIGCLNLSKPGSSNKEICQTVINNLHMIHKDDIVIIQWTYIERWCIFGKKGKHAIHHWQTQDTGMHEIFGKNFRIKNLKGLPDNITRLQLTIAKSFYKYIYDRNDMELELNRNMHYIGLLLDSKGIKNYHLHVDLNNILPWNNCTFLQELSINKVRKDFPKALDDHHPGKEAHAKHASNIFNALRRKK